MKKVILTAGFVLVATLVSAQERSSDDKRQDGPPSIEQIFKELDTNEDGKISLKEAKGPLKDDFKKIDTDEDGFLSKKEIKKAPKPERRERKDD